MGLFKQTSVKNLRLFIFRNREKMGTDFGSKMELIYFPVSGRALTSRLLMKSKGVNFTDTQISFADWATSGIKDTLPLGACPVLKVGDEAFCQTKAIEAYLGLVEIHYTI